jgi:tRNA dimethylallyltransferase
MESGFIEEVKRLHDLGYSSALPSMSAIGYREITGYIQGKISLDEAVVLMKRNSRTYVRRQANWFKDSDPDIKWFDGNELDFQRIINFLKSENGWIKPE